MKIIEKKMVRQWDKVEQIRIERRILEQVDHPFIVKFYGAFKSINHLHLLLDFCPGSEIFYHLAWKDAMSERHALFYFGETLLAIEYLHSKGILYWDLKPENILIDVDGHI